MTMMPSTRRALFLAAALVALIARPALGQAAKPAEAVTSHHAETLKHLDPAISHGKMGHAGVLVEHAEVALTHAEAAQKEAANPHTAEAIKKLKEAIAHGKMDHADVATKAAEGALEHLKMVK